MAAGFGYHSPQFSDETTWLPPWLQPHQLPGFGYRAKEERSFSLLGCSHMSSLDENVSTGHNLQFSKENYKPCHFYLSGDDETPAGSIPCPGTALHFQLHLSSGASEPFPYQLNEEALAGKDEKNEDILPDPVAEASSINKDTSDLHKVEVKGFAQLVSIPLTEKDENQALLLDHIPETPAIAKDNLHVMKAGDIPQAIPSAECDLKLPQEPVLDSNDKEDQKIGKRLQDDLDSGNLRKTDINDAVELSIAASEAMVISDMMFKRSESEHLNAAAILEIALRVKQARYLCHIDNKDVPDSTKEFDENDELSDLDDNIMADAFDDVGLCVTQVVGSPCNSQREFSERNHGLDVEKQQNKQSSSPDNLNIQISELPFEHIREKYVCKFGYQDSNHNRRPAPKDDALSIKPKNLPLTPLCMQQNRPSYVPLGPNVVHLVNLSIPQVEKVKSLDATMETQMCPKENQRISQNRRHEAKGDPLRKSIKGLFLGETSFISESLDLMNECQSEWRPQAEVEIVASSSTSYINVPVCNHRENESTPERETCCPDHVEPSSLSMEDPLCSVVPCSIISDDVASNQKCSQIKGREDSEKQICNGLLNLQKPSLPKVLDQHKDHDLSHYNAKNSCMLSRRYLKSLESYSKFLPGLHTDKEIIFGSKVVSSHGFAKNIMNLCSTERSAGILVSNDVEFFVFNKDRDRCREMASPNENRPNNNHSFRSEDQQNTTPFPVLETENDDAMFMDHEQDDRSLDIPFNAIRRRHGSSKIILRSDCEKGKSEKCSAFKMQSKPDVPSKYIVNRDQNRTTSYAPVKSILHLNALGNKRVCFLEAKGISDKITENLEPKFWGQSLQQETSERLKCSSTSCKFGTGKNDGLCTMKRKGMILYGLEFLLTGFSSQKEKELEESIRQHGGYVLLKVPACSKGLRGSWTLKNTNRKPPIILSPKKVQTTKFLYGCAINTWTLKANWVIDTVQAGLVLPPWKYMVRPIRPIPRNFIQIEERLCCQDHFLIFERVRVMLYGKVNFCTKFSNIIKHGGGQVFKSLQRLEQSLSDRENTVGIILVENEATVSRHLKHCALEYNLQIMPVSWVVSSLYSGKLLPVKKDRCAPLRRIKMPTFYQDPAAHMSQEI